MFSIPLYIVLFVYFLFLAFFATFCVINFYHIVASGTFTFPSFVITLFSFASTIITIYFTWYLLVGVNWQQPILIFNSSWIPNIFIIK